MLVHVGIDSVKLEGKGFEAFVKDGDKVKKGDLLLKVDVDYVASNCPSLATPVVCTELEENQKIRVLAKDGVKAGQPLFVVEKYEK